MWFPIVTVKVRVEKDMYFSSKDKILAHTFNIRPFFLELLHYCVYRNSPW